MVAAAFYLWIAFLLSWWSAAVWTDRGISRGTFSQQLLYFAGFAIGFTCLFTPPPGLFGSGHFHVGVSGLLPLRWQMPLWKDATALGALLIGCELVAFAFGWWARIHLGKLWSGMLTLREGHRVVDSGPYALVRHPIYTAFIAAAWALALIAANPPVLFGAAVLTSVMTVKAKTEEALLRRELGSAAYDAYSMRTPMLVPFARR